MSLDLTGINNVNGFYTDHYLATYFEGNVNDEVRRWREAEEENGTPIPWRALRDASKDYYRAVDGSWSRRDALATLAQGYLEALGYDAAEVAQVPCGETEIGVFAEYVNDDGSPRVWALLVRDSEDGDVLSAPVVQPGEASEITGEEAVNALLFKTEEPARFILILGMSSIALIDRNKWSEKKCIIVDLDEAFRRREETTFKAIATLFAATSLCPPTGETLLDELDKKSREHASGVSDSLKYALRESIELLGNEVIYDWTHNLGHTLEGDPIDERELTLECLRYMYRMLFLLFMEARPELGFAPMKSEVYLHAYSLESLREIADGMRDGIDTVNEETNYLDQTLDKICNLVYNGYPFDEEEYKRLAEEESVKDAFIVPPLKAHIFDEERTPLIRDAKLRDCVMLRIIDLMSVTRGDGRRRRERISYGTLGINQLGAVYEALLSYSGFIAKEDLYEVAKDANAVNELDVGYFVPLRDLGNYDEGERVRYKTGERAGELRCYTKGSFIYRLAGREREKSASFYTPECLTQCLVKYALKELLEGKTADEIINLTICEPAMGSAAFLNEAINQLAEAYIAKREEETGESIPHDERAMELQRVKMFIADRNVYGIDLNPIAVELGEVSLWLNTISQDGHVPWFGNQLHNGNSLIGARRRAYTPTQLKSSAKGIRWYDNEPEKVPYDADHYMKRVYHFLVGDPGMSKYDDKVIKQLEPDAIKAIKEWNKKFIKPYDDAQIRQLQHLSHVVGDLWFLQIQQQRDMAARTQDKLPVWKYDDPVTPSCLTTRQKDKIYSEMYLSEHQRNAGPFARLKFAMDYWCALWFWPIDKADLLPSREEFMFELSLILEGTVSAAVHVSESSAVPTLFDGKVGFEQFLTQDQLRFQSVSDELGLKYGMENEVDIDKLCNQFERLALVRDIADANRFFHWELEFADLFEARGGFDLVLGNPPWIKVEWNEQAVLSDEDPRFAVKRLSAAQTAELRPRALAAPRARARYFAEYEELAATKSFLNAAQNYALLKGQQTNLYRCFLPQAWDFGSAGGASAFVHPDGILNDSKAAPFRRAMHARYRRHFQFANELKLFDSVHHETVFSLNVYGPAREVPAYHSLSNLYDPSTVDACYAHDGRGAVPGVKTPEGRWCTEGHASRVIRVDDSALRTFAALLGDEDWRCSRVPVVHAQELMDVLGAIAAQPRTLGDLGEDVFTSECWHETGARKDGTLRDEVGFPPSAAESVYSGAQIGVANPVFQTTRAIYRSNADYDLVDLTAIPPDYLIRTKYRRACERAEYERRLPVTPCGAPFDAHYRLCNREYVGCSSERTLQAAILPPGQTWVHTIFGWCAPTSDVTRVNTAKTTGLQLLSLMAGCCASLPFDYFSRANGKGHVNYATTMQYPVVESPFNAEIRCRALLLNCLTAAYADLWAAVYDPAFNACAWSKGDVRLPAAAFSGAGPAWTWGTPLRTDYARRAALAELDVLVSLALGLSLEQLETVYRLDFSVLQSYERETWYDANGRIAYSKKKLDGSRFTRQEFEQIADAKEGTFSKTFTDDTMPGGPVERTVEYVAPFDKCDRIEDYRTAWAFFEEKHGKQGGVE